MRSRKRRPLWWQLWLLFPVLGIPAYLDVKVAMPVLAHRIVEIGFVLVIFGLVTAWLRANEVAILREQGSHVVWSEAERTVWLPPEPGAIAGNNGNGHKSEWVLPAELPEAGAVGGDRTRES